MEEIEIQEGQLFENFQIELNAATKIFEYSLFNQSGNSIFCTIHSLLRTNNDDHNCIGCNIDDNLKFMRSEFGISKHLESIEEAVSYTHLRAHETDSYLVCRLLL